ncbi:hypothetical protein [Paracidovorax citrulli]
MTLDDAEEGWHVRAYWNGDTWNGFIEPGFDTNALREVARRFPQLVQVASDGTASIFDEYEGGHTVLLPMTLETDEGELTLHFFPGWCWFLVGACENLDEVRT